MIKKLSVVILCVVCLANTCEKHPLSADYAYNFWIQNNSSDSISYMLGMSYPDTSIPAQELSVVTLKPGARSPNDSNKDWPKVIASLPADTLSIFFFSRDTLVKYGFERVRNDYKILERKDISSADLENSNNTVSYP